ncbi:MAG: aminotransferase class I/II-fold pyridoxal phosphate-dependent enzyme [Gammaproteobacteria bacterium]|nr:aminotransferase class I/II-fold pyridoxal phosphate-dependent enzyme [Gammaproteobacteria bacterium]
MSSIEPFHVMDILARARQLESQGRHIVHMEVGEPDFVTLPGIVDAGRQALADGKVHYTPATGLVELREAISAWYLREYDEVVPMERIVVTPGASGALQLALGVTVNPGDGVLIADPGYPCNRHMVAMYGAEIHGIPVDETSNFQLNLDLIRQHWQSNSRAVMLASPSNPTGTLIEPAELGRICDFVKQQQGVVIVDEIYHGLIYQGDVISAVGAGDNVIVINSFSKYFGMTGWRLGWLVAPYELINPIDRLAQNIFLAPATPSQYAALVALSESLKPALDERRNQFQQRRDYLLPAIRELGFETPCKPQGAFYLYARSTALAGDSMALCRDLLEQAGVAITPGVDFGNNHSNDFVRFAYTTGMDELKTGVSAIRQYLS